MPWTETSVMEERLRFVARLLEGEPMSDVCREFGISRKTGYKLFERYREEGPVALADRSRRPVRYANQLPAQVEMLIIACKREKPHWGARKIREVLVRRLAVTPHPGHHPCRARPPWPGPAHGQEASQGHRHALSTGAAPTTCGRQTSRDKFKLGNGDCQEFRVRAVMMGRKEIPHGPTQGTTDSGRAAGSVAGRGGPEDGI